MKIGILTIGDEITSGRIQDTNTAYLAREFHVRGWDLGKRGAPTCTEVF